MGIVAAQHLSKWYGQVIGLNDVTLTVPPGITGLLGPNGAGKSTFMKLMTGQLKPSQGAITVLGEPIWGNPALYFRIGFCPEQDAFYERMTGLEWVTALVRLNGVDDAEADRLARRALDLVELTDVGGKKIGAYSKGMRQRVKMAQALVHDPELIVLDEPLSGMDPIVRRKTIRMIKEWGRQGKSIIVSSHILHEIEAMTANILLINQGRILAEGDVHQIRDLIDEHPHTVHIRAERTRALAREFLAYDDVLSLKFEDDAVVVETGRPDVFYARLTELAASGELGVIHEVTSPDDNLQAVFQYLVKSVTMHRADSSAAVVVVVGPPHLRPVARADAVVAPLRVSRPRRGRSGRSGCRAPPGGDLGTPVHRSIGPRPAGGDDLRNDDLAHLRQIPRSRARRVLWHVAHCRRDRRQDPDVSLHPPDSARRRHPRQVPRVSRLHRAPAAAFGRDRVLSGGAARPGQRHRRGCFRRC